MFKGKDKDYFKINKTTAILTPKYKMDREYRDKYDVIVRASEYCSCLSMTEEIEPQCSLMNLHNDTFEFNDISQLRVRIYLEDINDNSPKFSKNFYQIGITSDTEYGETILESYVSFFLYKFKK